MKVFHAIAEAKELEGASLCLGNFDGVHVGHRALFAEAARWGRPAAFTFHPHPGKVLAPDLAPKLITLLPRKLELLEEAGLEAVVVQPFGQEYANSTPAQFEASLLDELKVSHLVVGNDFTYGQKRQGTALGLERAAAARGAQLHVVEPVAVEGVVASSTKIREYILEGRVAAARKLLGRWFDLDGRVVPGAGRGKGIGFPTANVDTPNELRPGPGVYAVRARVLKERGEQAWRGGAANIGIKPTFGGTEVTIEVHLFDFNGELYGKELRVEFLDRLRAEQRFHSVSELVGQIQRDVEAARAIVARAS
jgi:riboflavin kinase/FMN adenylyltransferase